MNTKLSNRTILFLFSIVIMITIEFGSLSIFKVSAPDAMSVKRFLIFISLFLIVSLLLFIHQDQYMIKRNGALRAIVLFSLSFCIVHFQSYFDIALGIAKVGSYSGFSSYSSIIKSSVLSLVGFQSSLFGYSLTGCEEHKRSSAIIEQITFKPRLFKILSAIMLLIVLFMGRGYYFTMSYSLVDNTGSALSYASLLFSIILYITLILSVCEYQTNNTQGSIMSFVAHIGPVFNMVVFIYLIAVFSSGDRGAAMNLMIAYGLSAFIATKQRFSFKLFAVVGIVAALFLSMLGIIRKDNTVVDIEEQFAVAYEEVGEIKSIFPATKELAGSVRTLHSAVEYVPDVIPHTKGVFQLTYLSQAIPFSSSLFSPLFKNSRFTRSTALLTWIINGDNPSSGTGTTCIADAYIDLGIIGVIIIMFLWGMLLKKTERLYFFEMSKMSVWDASLYFIASVLSFYIPRSAILFHIKDFFWLFLVLIFTLFISKSR